MQIKVAHIQVFSAYNGNGSLCKIEIDDISLFIALLSFFFKIVEFL